MIESSGYGADKFTMVRNNDGTGSLKIVQSLDYEDQLQSNGFRFRIQVNDKVRIFFHLLDYSLLLFLLRLVQGEDNDNDKYHVAYSWVVVKLRDINDNQPQFEKANIETTVPENARIGNSLETFKATDPDQGGKSKVYYSIDRSSDRKRQFSINENGTVSIQRSLDREETPRHQVTSPPIPPPVPCTHPFSKRFDVARPPGEDLGDRRRDPAENGDGHVDRDRARHKRQSAPFPQGLSACVARALPTEESGGDIGNGRRRSVQEQRAAVHLQDGPEGGRRDSRQLQSGER